MQLSRLLAPDSANPFIRLFALLGLLQGALAALIYYQLDYGRFPEAFFLPGLGKPTPAIPALVTAGLLFFLAYLPGHGRRTAAVAGLFGLGHLALWLLAQIKGLDKNSLILWIAPWYICSLALSYTALPFLQSFIQNRRWRTDYATLFRHSWNNIQIIASAYLLAGLFFLVMHLAGSLLEVVKISLLSTLLQQAWFTIPAYCVVKAVGYAIARENESIVLSLRRLCLGFCRFLAPILAVCAAVFVVMLPFAGLQSIWATRMATPIFISFAGLIILFFNAIMQDGGNDPFKGFGGKLQRVALMVLPVFGLLAIYSTGLRIAQYGLTPERYYAILLCIIISAYGLIYAFASIRPRAIAILQRGNIAMALAIIALALAVHLPFINAPYLSAWHRYALIAANRLPPPNYDLWWLKNELGADGGAAFDRLKTLTAHPRQKELQDAIRTAAIKRYRHDNGAITATDADLRTIAGYVRVSPGPVDIPPGLLDLLVKKDSRELQRCHNAANEGAPRCNLLHFDLNRDGAPEFVLLNNWQASLYVQHPGSGLWEKSEYTGKILTRPRPGAHRNWQNIMETADSFTTSPPAYDDILVGDDVKITFSPNTFPPVNPPLKP